MRTAIAALVFAVCLSSQTKKVVLANLPPAAMEEIERSAPAGVKIVRADRSNLAAEAVDADALVGTGDPKLVGAARKLKWVQTTSAGVESVLTPEFEARGITLTNAKIIQGPNIADHAFALLLSLTRELYRTIPNRTSEEWTRGRHRPIELNGKTAVIIGVGGIGMQIAQRAVGFGMQVIGVDPKDISYTPLVTRVVPPDRLDTVLPLADVVFVAAPLTKESRGMIGARQFEMMKQGAYFIAVSRGGLYSSEALVKALDSKHLAGAGLDVTNPEPLPKGHPLWKFENVIITPHMAGGSDKVTARRVELFKENIRRFSQGEPLLNVVDLKKGY